MTRRRLANRRPAVTGHNNNSRQQTHLRRLPAPTLWRCTMNINDLIDHETRAVASGSAAA
jgi:hypothetical protein